jgi:hypothetical protein
MLILAFCLMHFLGIAQQQAASHQQASPQTHRTVLYVGNSRGDDITVIDLGSLKIVDQT